MFFVDEVTIAEDGNPKIILQEVAENGLERRSDTDSGERGAAMRIVQELHSPESSVQGISERDTARDNIWKSRSSLAIQGGQRDFIRSGRSGTSPDSAVRETYGEIEKDDAGKKKCSQEEDVIPTPRKSWKKSFYAYIGYSSRIPEVNDRSNERKSRLPADRIAGEARGESSWILFTE